MKRIEPMPCPFCGKDAQDWFLPFSEKYRIECPKCRIVGQDRRTLRSAIKWWNTRKQPKQQNQ